MKRPWLARLALPLLAAALLAAAPVPAPASGGCQAEQIKLEKQDLTAIKTPYFKRWAMYTRGGKYDPSQDLVYFMALNFKQGNALTLKEYAQAETILGKVPGASEYLAPTIAELQPHMWKYLEALRLNVSGRESAQAYADALLADMKPVLAEALGGNRLVYAAIESPTQKIVRSEGGTYVVAVEGCPGKLTQFDMSDYVRFNSLAEEQADLKARLDRPDVRSFSAFVAANLEEKSWFKGRLLGLLKDNP
jgi:hypothetical protein